MIFFCGKNKLLIELSSEVIISQNKMKVDMLKTQIQDRYILGLHLSAKKDMRGSTKCLMFQVLFMFFIKSYNLQKPLQFIFLFFQEITKMKIKSFECPRSIRNYEKKKCHMLGQRVVCPIGPAIQCIILQIVGSAIESQSFLKSL